MEGSSLGSIKMVTFMNEGHEWGDRKLISKAPTMILSPSQVKDAVGPPGWIPRNLPSGPQKFLWVPTIWRGMSLQETQVEKSRTLKASAFFLCKYLQKGSVA
jgi:hypothetical protein